MNKTTSGEITRSIPQIQQDPGILWSQPKLTVLSGEEPRDGGATKSLETTCGCNQRRIVDIQKKGKRK